MFKGAIKDDLQLLGSELDLEINEKMSVYELDQIIKMEKYTEDNKAVNEHSTYIVETRKAENSKLLQLEKLKLESSKNEWKLARICAIPKTEDGVNNEEKI